MFPRFGQHCFSHHIPIELVNDVNDDFDDALLQPESFQIALNYLRERNADLRKGDLILFDSKIGYRNNGVAIFDGVNIVELYGEVDDYGSLPREFRVIEDNVPINYWKDIDEEDDTKRGITHNNIVWFDHALVRDQCLKNLRYCIIEGDKHGIMTTFVFNQVHYWIIFDYSDCGISGINYATLEIKDPVHLSHVLNKCQQTLQGDDLIIFENENISEVYESNNGHTLFCQLR